MKKTGINLFLASLMLVLAACGGKPATQSTTEIQSKPEPAAQPAPAAQVEKVEKVTIKVGGTAKASLKHYPILVANHPSISEKTGITFEFTELKSTGETRKEMQLGNLDFGLIVSTDLMLDTAKDIQILSVVSTSPLEGLIVNSKYKDQIKSVKDLVGKPVGVTAVGSATHNMLNSILLMNGIDPTAVKVLPVGADVAKPFAEDQVVAAVTFEPYVYNLTESGKAFLLQDVRFGPDIQKIFGEKAIPWTILAVRGEVAAKDPKLMKRVRDAVNLAVQKMSSTSPEEVLQLLPTDMQNAQNLALYKANRDGFPLDSTPKQNELAAIVTNMKSIKAIPASFEMAPTTIWKE